MTVTSKGIRLVLALCVLGLVAFGVNAEENKEKTGEERDKELAEKEIKEEAKSARASAEEISADIESLEERFKTTFDALQAEESRQNPSEAKRMELRGQLEVCKTRLIELGKKYAETFERLSTYEWFKDISNGLPARKSMKQPWNGMWRTNPAMGDVNNDGYLDIAAICRLGPGVKVWLSDGKDGWIDSSNGLPRGAAGGGAKFADINKDGNLDLIAGIHCGGVRCWFGDGKGNWKDASKGLLGDPSTGDSMDVAVADFDEDGHLDIAFSGWNADVGIRIFAGDSKGNWKEMKDTGLPVFDGRSTSLSANAMITTDVNNDGHADIVASLKGPWWKFRRMSDPVWLGDGKGNFTNGSIGIHISRSGGTWGVAAADVNGDGNIDLAFASPSLRVYLGNGHGIWEPHPKGAVTGGYYYGVGFGDFNGDGIVDLVGVSRGNVVILKGNGKGDFETMRVQGMNPPMVNGYGVAVGDINGDGFDDILAGFGNEEISTMMRMGLGLSGGKKVLNSGGWVKVWLSRPMGKVLKGRIDELSRKIDKALQP